VLLRLELYSTFRDTQALQRHYTRSVILVKRPCKASSTLQMLARLTGPAFACQVVHQASRSALCNRRQPGRKDGAVSGAAVLPVAMCSAGTQCGAAAFETALQRQPDSAAAS